MSVSSLLGRRSVVASAAIACAAAWACGGGSASSGGGTTMSPGPSMLPMPDVSAALLRAPSPDPRVGLKAGLQDAGEAAWNIRKISHTPPPEGLFPPADAP